MTSFAASDANNVERLGGTMVGGGLPGAPTGPAGGGLAGTYPNPTIAAGAVTEAGLSLSNVTTANVTSTAHGFAPRSPGDAAQFLNGAATPGFAAVTDANLSLSDVTTNNVSTTAHGFAPKLPNDAAKFLNGVGGYTSPPAAAVSSVFGRVGAVVSATNDYTDAQVQNSPTNKLTTTGDLLYASGANTLARLGIGATGQVLGIAAGVPAWVYPPGFEWGYDETQSTVNVVSTTEATPTTIFTCASHTFDGAPVMAEFFGALRSSTAAGGQIVTMLFESTTEVGRFAASSQAAATQQTTITLTASFRFTPSAGAHTYIVAAFVASTSGTPFVAGGPGGAANNTPVFVRFTKV